MSQPVQPPNSPQQPYDGQPAAGNPYAAQQPGQPGNPYAGQPGQPGQPGNPYAGQQPGAPTGNPFAGQQPGQFGGGNPFAPAPPARNNVGVGVLTALGTAIVAAILYGVIAGSIEREISYAALGVGFLVGYVASKVGGSNVAVVASSALFSLVAVFLGQIIAMSMIYADGVGVGFSEVFFNHFGDMVDIWKEASDVMTYLFLILGAVATIGGAKKAG